MGIFPCVSAIAKPLIGRLKQMRLRADDFETLNIIGRGAFGEVVCVCVCVCVPLCVNSGYDFMLLLLGLSCEAETH